MGPITVAELAEGALLLMDSAPIIYFLEANPKFSPIFKPVFVAHDAGHVQFAVTTIRLGEAGLQVIRPT